MQLFCIALEQLGEEPLDRMVVDLGIWVEKLEGDVNEALKPWFA